MSHPPRTATGLRLVLQDALLSAGRASPLLWLAVALWLAVPALAALVLLPQYAARAQDQQALQAAQSAQAQRAQASQDRREAGLAQPLSQSESSQRNAAQFKALLAQAPLPEDAQKTLFALAKRWELDLPQGQYQQACDETGTWCSYRMQLPVAGAYTAVRGFVQEALHTVPSMALDGAAFKREAAATDELEVALRWTLYQAPKPAGGRTP